MEVAHESTELQGHPNLINCYLNWPFLASLILYFSIHRAMSARTVTEIQNCEKIYNFGHSKESALPNGLLNN